MTRTKRALAGLAAAALAATAQNAAGDSDSLRAKCCGIAGVVGGANIDAR